MHYEREGDGEPLVLLHGIGGELCVWEPVLGALACRRDVIAVDLPGFGRSPALPDGVVPTPQALAAAVGDLMDELGIDRAHVAGNSLGGWIALELARSGRALSVVGLCPAGLWGAPLLPAGGRGRGRGDEGAGSSGRAAAAPILPLLLLSRRARRLALGAFVANPDRVPYHAAWRMVRSYGRSTAYEATSTAMRQGHFAAPEEIRVPVTLAFGEFDRLIRPARIDGFRSVMMPGCGHVPMWDDPELVSDLCLAGSGDPAGRERRGTPSLSGTSSSLFGSSSLSGSSRSMTAHAGEELPRSDEPAGNERRWRWPGAASTPPSASGPLDYVVLEAVFATGMAGLIGLTLRREGRDVGDSADRATGPRVGDLHAGRCRREGADLDVDP